VLIMLMLLWRPRGLIGEKVGEGVIRQQ
jgi:branched-subunit amino acid ABC-type transport system permease component